MIQAVIDPAAIAQIGTFIGLIVVGIMNKLDARKAVKAAQEASKIAIDTHVLVNSNMGLQLRKAMLQSRRIADMTIDPVIKAEAVKIADEDEDIWKRHMAKQAVIDAANALIEHIRNEK